MLLRMIPEAVSKAWPEISEHIKRALPEDEKNGDVLNNLLDLLLLGQADCWVSYDPKNDNKANFVVVTVPIHNGITGEKNLLLYNVTVNDKIDLKTSNRMWLEGYQALNKFMRANGFNKLVSYFDGKNSRSFKLAKRFGADVKYYIEVNMDREWQTDIG